jgi:hypothetical protein
MKRTVVWLTDAQAKTLAVMSKKSLAPVSALVRQAVAEFLRKRSNHWRIKVPRKALKV